MENPNDSDSKISPCCASLEERVRENPTQAILAAVGVGFAVALILRALNKPAEPRSQARQLLEDIQERLHDLADPALNRLQEFAKDGSAAFEKGASQVQGARQQLRSLGSKLANLFH